MVSPHSQLLKVTQRVIERSKPTRDAYLARIEQAQGKFPARGALSCANLAHGFAGLEGNDKLVDQADPRAEHRHRVLVQRDAVGARAVQELPATSSSRPRVKTAAWRNSRAACRPCATASRKATRAWSCRCSRAKSSR